MEFQATLKEITRDLYGRVITTFISHDIAIQSLVDMKDSNLNVKVTKHREKRSLDANSYYWVLVGQLADKLHQSTNYIHNKMLRAYGQIEMIDGKAVYIVIPDTEQARKDVDDAQEYHLRPTSEVKAGKDGKSYRTYMMLKGSSSYDSKEMARLIDGVVYECRELGIETLPPDEIKRFYDNRL